MTLCCTIATLLLVVLAMALIPAVAPVELLVLTDVTSTNAASFSVAISACHTTRAQGHVRLSVVPLPSQFQYNFTLQLAVPIWICSVRVSLATRLLLFFRPPR